MSLGWRFVFDRDGLDRPSGDHLGLVQGAAPGPGTVSDDALVRQALMMLLSTAPGERVMRPDWGCPLNRILFLPNDGATAGLAIHYVRQAISRFEPRVSVLDVDAAADPNEDGCLRVFLRYRIKRSGTVEALSFVVDLDGVRP